MFKKLDYKIKVLESSLGYDYAVNELVLMNTLVLAIKGLGNAALNALYYPRKPLIQ
jgi:hypothetical protein